MDKTALLTPGTKSVLDFTPVHSYSTNTSAGTWSTPLLTGPAPCDYDEHEETKERPNSPATVDEQSKTNPSCDQAAQDTERQQQPSTLSESSESRIWLGTLSWVNPHSKDSTQIYVQMVASESIQLALWPSSFEIDLSSAQPVPSGVLKRWIFLYTPILCQIRPFCGSFSPQENAFRYQCLTTLIHVRNTYVMGRRIPAVQNAEPSMLLFPTEGDASQLTAAFFPETGVPVVPHLPPINPGSQSASNRDPEMIAKLRKLSPEARRRLFARIRQVRQERERAQNEAQTRPYE